MPDDDEAIEDGIQETVDGVPDELAEAPAKGVVDPDDPDPPEPSEPA
jgi:hypothetical protein